MKVRKLGRQHMKIGETFSHHPMVHKLSGSILSTL